MNDIIFLLIVIIAVFSIVGLMFRKFKRREKEGIEKALSNPVILNSSPEYTWEEQSKNSDLLFRCPNARCRAFFVEPRLVVDHMVKEREPPKKYNTCPKCGTLLEQKKEVNVNG